MVLLLPDPSFDTDQLYAVTVTPVEGLSRRFVAEYYPLPWDVARDDVCFYAGSVQGGKLREIEDDKTFNDPQSLKAISLTIVWMDCLSMTFSTLSLSQTCVVFKL